MSVYRVSAEHCGVSGREAVKAFAKSKGIRITKAWADETFTAVSHFRVVGGGARIRNFIWDNVNHGAWCEVKKVG